MIIFGWGKTMTKNYGPVKTYQCGRCNNTAEWNLFRISTWFTLYFIPIFPYSYKRYLVCPICGACIELDKKEFVELKTMINGHTQDTDPLTQPLTSGHVNRTETQLNYLRQMEEIERERDQKLHSTENSG